MAATMSRPVGSLFQWVEGTDRRRHLMHAAGGDSAFPRAMCDAGIRLRDDPAATECVDCRRRALTEVALTLSRTFGLDRLGAEVAVEVRLLSYGEAPAEQTA